MTKAFAPANISCIFVIYIHKDPKKMGSLGIGITLSKGAIVTAKKSKKTIIKVNSKKISYPTVLDVIKSLTDQQISINIRYQLPYGCGFGMSGASALAAAYAINSLLKLKKSKKQLATTAHVAEVNNRTGLGDVAGQYNGGICIKYQKGSPLKVIKLKTKDKFIYYKVFSPLDTKKVITNNKIKQKINKAGIKSLKKVKLLENKDLNKIIKISREFTINSRLAKHKKVKNLIKCKNISMIMLGNAVYSDKPFKGCKKAKISKKGAHLL